VQMGRCDEAEKTLASAQDAVKQLGGALPANEQASRTTRGLQSLSACRPK
jgi:hypothetical protein